MLLGITNYCSMGCSHCLSDCTTQGEHMSAETLAQSIRFIDKLRPKVLMISGGEPTEHPNFIEFMEQIRKQVEVPITILSTNGTFTDKPDVLEYLKKRRELMIQVTNVPMYYPKRIKKVNASHFMYVDSIADKGGLTPMGRAVTNKLAEDSKKAPSCFNLRSICHYTNSLRHTLELLERANKFCAPAISPDGSIRVGEAEGCAKVGTVNSTFAEIVEGIKNVDCNICGLMHNLGDEHKRAVKVPVDAYGGGHVADIRKKTFKIK